MDGPGARVNDLPSALAVNCDRSMRPDSGGRRPAVLKGRRFPGRRVKRPKPAKLVVRPQLRGAGGGETG